MKSTRILSICMFLVAAALYAQTEQAQSTPSAPAVQPSPILTTLTSAFDRGDSQTKLQVMKRADSQPAGQMVPLYVHALDFVVNNGPEVKTDTALNQIALLTVRNLAKAGQASVLEQLWHLFVSVDDNTIRIETLNAIGALGKGYTQTVVNLNGWIQGTALSAQSGVRPDLEVVYAAAANLAKIAEESSFPVFLHVILAQLSNPITAAAENGLFGIKGDTAALAVSAVGHLDLSQWSYAAQYFFSSSKTDAATKTKIGAGVLTLAVAFRTADEQQSVMLRDVRAALVRNLTQYPGPEAVDALVRNFNLTVQEFDAGRTTRDRLLESIASLGASGADPAAARLSDFLNVLNTYTERDRSYDTQVVLAVINNLKILGKQLAYQSVYYATLLKYPSRVLQAAQDALGALQK